jgi:hypothetical protein
VNVPALGGLSITIQRDAGLRFLHPSNVPGLDFVVDDILLSELSLNALGYQALIGRDVLDSCLFIMDGEANSFTLAY